MRRDPRFWGVSHAMTGAFFIDLVLDALENLHQIGTQSTDDLLARRRRRTFSQLSQCGKGRCMQPYDPVAGRKCIARIAKKFTQYTANQVTTRCRGYQTLCHDHAESIVSMTGVGHGDVFGGNFRPERRERSPMPTSRSVNSEPLSPTGFAGIKNNLELGRLK